MIRKGQLILFLFAIIAPMVLFSCGGGGGGGGAAGGAGKFFADWAGNEARGAYAARSQN